MNFLVVGGSSGLGRALTAGLAARGHDVVVISSDARDAEAQSADLRLRHGVRSEGVALDLGRRDLDLKDLDDALVRLGPMDGIVVTAGASRQEDVVGEIGEFAEEIVRINFLGPCRVIEHCLARLKRSRSSLVLGIGSVAACRGRRRNAAYSAAKRALGSYFESLRHAAGTEGPRIHYCVVGYLDTNLAFGLDLPLAPADPREVARRILDDLGRPSGTRYYPRYWRPLSVLLRLLPWALFLRLRA